MHRFYAARDDPEEFLLICCNFTPVVRKKYELHVAGQRVITKRF